MAKAAGERAALGMADVRTALEIGDCGLGQMSVVMEQIVFGYREGELEAWEDYSFPEYYQTAVVEELGDIEMGGMNGSNGVNGVNGMNGHSYEAESDSGWIGGESEDKTDLDNLLDSCLAIGA
jgi:transcriptional coactivator HFI1/ADA1